MNVFWKEKWKVNQKGYKKGQYKKGEWRVILEGWMNGKSKKENEGWIIKDK